MNGSTHSSHPASDWNWFMLSIKPIITLEIVLNNVVSPHYSINPFDLLKGTLSQLNGSIYKSHLS